MKTLLEIKNLRVTFEFNGQKVHAVKDSSLKINKGECLAIVGESGSGKSTLINILLGLLKPKNGKVLTNGLDINNFISDWQKSLGYVSQNIFLLDV